MSARGAVSADNLGGNLFRRAIDEEITFIKVSDEMPAINALVKPLLNPRLIALFFFGFSSGLPAALVGATLGAWYTEAGVSLVGIGLLTLVGQPYAYKFLWSPLLDRYIPPFLGHRRGWILLTQLALIMGLIGMALLRPETSPSTLALLAFAVAFCSASQDIGIGAYLVEAPLPHERGLAATSQTLGYRVAMLVSGALGLVMAQAIGWHSTYLIMSALMLIGVCTSFWAPEPARATPTTPLTLRQATQEPFRDFWQRFGWRDAVILFLIIVFYKLGDAFFLSFNTTFLLRDLHFTLTEVGLANKSVSVIASIVGGVVGGLLMLRLRLFTALIAFGLLQGVANLSYMWLAESGHNFPLMVFAIASEQFCSALGTVAFIALLIKLCNPRYSATQYALLSALTAIGRVYVGPSAAVMIDHIGWFWFYGATFLISLPGVLLLGAVRHLFAREGG